jgi:hypothetical protein
VHREGFENANERLRFKLSSTARTCDYIVKVSVLDLLAVSVPDGKANKRWQ